MYKLQKMKNSMNSSPTLKLVLIGIIIIFLLIPTSMIDSIIHEREMLNISASHEVSEKWASAQTINGPILTIPYTKDHIINEKVSITEHQFHILPSNLEVETEVLPQSLRRGIYEVVVYSADMNIGGVFEISKIQGLVEAKNIKWDEAFISIGIQDLRGIKNELFLNWDNSNLAIRAGTKIKKIIPSGITVQTPLKPEDHETIKSFSINLQLNGSENLSFVPVGGVTKVNIRSSWPDPSFNGSFLPEKREVSDDGFTATWTTLELNRNYPQAWNDYEVTQALLDSKFGVDLLLPIDDYQKSTRSSKYAILMLALTFLVFFLIEVMTNHRIHPFQYILVGLALCLFYILLVSISEHSNFDLAYLLSSACIVLMIGLYSLSVFQHKKYSIILVLILLGVYGFLYVLLQLSDFALLMGSIGLTVILSTTMFFTRRINWYNLSYDLGNHSSKN